MDPPVSESQRRAMEAAAHGHSTLGIPESVGKEFVGDSSIKAAGICMVAPTGRALFLLRTDGTWGFPGGRAEGDESPEQAARREMQEEIKASPYGELSVMSHVTGSNDIEYVTFEMPIMREFTPKLKLDEHTEYRWASADNAPEPLHPGVRATLTGEMAQDYTVHTAGAAKFYASPVANTKVSNETVENTKVGTSSPNYKRDGSSAAGRQGSSGAADSAIAPREEDVVLAFDRASVRTLDADGRMHVEITNLSKANICPYFGYEIPDGDKLGLEPDQVYMLFRDPAELEKAARTSNNIQLLEIHEPVSADDPKREIVIGSTGTDGVFDAPYLRNSLVIWDAEAIKRIERRETQELSCAYRYKPVMDAGTYEGIPYDGRMTQLSFNHVALVATGRAGPDCVVGDSDLPLESENMSKPLSNKAALAKGVLLAVLKPQFAADKMPDLDSILAGVNKKNWLEKKPGIVAAIKPKMGADADIEGLVNLLDSLDNAVPMSEDADEVDNEMSKDSEEDDAVEAIMATLRGKISDEDYMVVEAKIREMAKPVAHIAPGASDEPAPFEGKPEVGGEKVDKPAMDAAIRSATKLAEDAAVARINAVHAAHKAVTPYVGELSIACDTAEGVYRAALNVLGVDVAGVHPSAFAAVLRAQPLPGSEVRTVRLAHDSSKPAGYDEQRIALGLKA